MSYETPPEEPLGGTACPNTMEPNNRSAAFKACQDDGQSEMAEAEETTMTIRVALYARVSAADQTPVNQLDALKAFAAPCWGIARPSVHTQFREERPASLVGAVRGDSMAGREI